MTTFVYLF